MRGPDFRSEPPERLVRLARAVHRLMQQMLTVAEGDPRLDEDLDHATRALEAANERLARHARGPELDLGEPATERARPYYVRGALVGAHHPMFPALEIETEDGVTRGSVSLDVVWEGPPGCVHGGYVAYLYDCIMGHHNLAIGIPGMTGTLQVRYRRPTPLYTQLDFEVRTAKAAGRKIVTRARVHAEGRLLSQAEGLFIVPRDFRAALARK